MSDKLEYLLVQFQLALRRYQRVPSSANYAELQYILVDLSSALEGSKGLK